MADAFTNLQNRLRVVTKDQRELIRVTEELLQVANRSRSSFESTAELYSRLSLATRELNLEGANLVKITESINKAIILSGASAKEANNGLIQLSQGLASGRLTGDELRSTLEQLPVVADVIAKQLGVTRGELRALGAQGEITSIKIIRAFQAAEKELEEKFAKTVPTLSQSFVVLRNNVVAFVGRINEGTGILRGFGAAIRFVGSELDAVIKIVGTLGAALLAIKFAPVIQGLANVSKAIRTGTAVRLGSVAAINAQNAALAVNTAATLSAATAEVARLQGVIASTLADTVHNTVLLSKNQAMLALAATEQALIPIRAQLTVATNALAAAEARAAAAAGVAATRVTVFGLAAKKAKFAVINLTKAIAANPIGIFVVAITAAVAALVFFRNDIKLTEDGVATLGDTFTAFFDQLKVALSVIGDFFSENFGEAFDIVVAFVRDFDLQWRDLLLIPAAVLDTIVGLFAGAFAAIISIYIDLPSALGDIFVRSTNAIIGAIEFIPDVYIGALKTIGQAMTTFINGAITGFTLLGQALKAVLERDFKNAVILTKGAAAAIARGFDEATSDIGAKLTENIDAELKDELLPRLENTFEGGLGEIGTRAAAAFSAGFNANVVTDFALGILKDAEQIGIDREAAEAANARAASDVAAANATQDRLDSIQKILGPLKREAELLVVTAQAGEREAAIQGKILAIQDKLAAKKIFLTDVEAMALEQTVRGNTSLAEQVALQQRLLPLQDELAERTRIANAAFATGIISIEQYAQELRDIELTSAAAGKSIGDGITTGLAQVTESLSDFASATEDVLVNAFQGAEDGLVEFVNTGKFSFEDFASSIASDIARVLAKLLLLQTFSGLGGLFGGTSLGSFFSGLSEAAHGDPSLDPNVPTIVGEEGPEILQGQTGSITPTDQTIAALTNGAANSKETIVVQAPAPAVNLQTIVVDDPSQVPSAIESPDGTQAILNVIERNPNSVNRRLNN